MAYIKRYLFDKISDDLQKGKIIIVYGARQVGKTTLVKEIIRGYPKSIYINGDFVDDQQKLSESSRTMVEQFAGYDMLVIDEAQRIPDIGLKLKVIFDTLPTLKILVTGSSAFEISSTVSEPLTGRFIAHVMYPISLSEMQSAGSFDLNTTLLYGAYPDIVTAPSVNDKRSTIINISSNYLFKDVLNIEYIKSPRALELLLTALASQLGNEVSAHEISNTLDVDSKTVQHYIDILEKLFIVFSLRPHASNVRKSITKKRKYYFYDLGIRNAVLNNFSPLEGRADIGALWENFCIVERMKNNAVMQRFIQYRFWRSYAGDEIDLLEIEDQKIRGFECKWNAQQLSERVQTIYRDDLHGVGDITVLSSDAINNILRV